MQRSQQSYGYPVVAACLDVDVKADDLPFPQPRPTHDFISAQPWGVLQGIHPGEVLFVPCHLVSIPASHMQHPGNYGHLYDIMCGKENQKGFDLNLSRMPPL